AGTGRAAYYGNLSPGRHEFHVMPYDPFKDWTEAATTLPIHLAGRLSENRWFRGGVALAAGLALAAGARWRWRELQKLHTLERQAALTNERARLARDLHDQLGAELTRAARLSEQLEKSDARPPVLEKSRLRETLRAMRQRIDAVVWAVSPEKDRLTSMIDFT